MGNSHDYIIVVGVHKSGTTSLFDYLSTNPDIYTPSKKEIHYFTPLVYGKKTDVIDNYLNNYREAKDNQLCLDISPSYFYGGQKVIDAIKSLGKVKILLLLRNPTDRLISFYKQGVSLGFINANESFEDYFDKTKKAFDQYTLDHVQLDDFYNRGFREGCYSLYLSEWIENFGEDLRIIYSNDLQSDTKITMQGIASFLHIKDIYDTFEFSNKNQSYKPRSQKLSQFANKIFTRNESFFRKNKFLKKMLTTVYSKVNATKYASIENETYRRVESVYAPYNTDLKELLIKYHQPIPNWIV